MSAYCYELQSAIIRCTYTQSGQTLTRTFAISIQCIPVTSYGVVRLLRTHSVVSWNPQEKGLEMPTFLPNLVQSVSS